MFLEFDRAAIPSKDAQGFTTPRTCYKFNASLGQMFLGFNKAAIPFKNAKGTTPGTCYEFNAYLR